MEQKLKTARINLRVTEEDKTLIFDRADELHISASNYIVACIRKNKIVHLEDINYVISHLYKIGANINQIAKKVNSSDTVSPNEVKKIKKLVVKCFRIIDEFVEKNCIENLDQYNTLNDILKKLNKIEKKMS